MQHRLQKRRVLARNGFTLIEVLAVMAIIAVLFAMVIGLVEYAKRQAMVGKARAEVQQLRSALDEHFAKHGRYPAVVGYTNALMGCYSFPSTFNFVDPWKTNYVYELPSPYSYSIYSMGPDGVAGTADDIHSGR